MPVWHKNKMFNINDKVCRDNGLSVIERKTGKKGKNWYQYEGTDDDKAWRDKIKDAIDAAVKEAENYEDFLSIMEMEGFDHEETNTLLRFRATSEGQVKFTRTKTIGPAYTKDIIKRRIEDKDFVFTEEKAKTQDTAKRKNASGGSRRKPEKGVNLIVDISKNIKAQQSKGYEHALVMANINAMVKTMNYLEQHGLATEGELDRQLEENRLMRDELAGKLDTVEKARKMLSEKIKYSQNYVKYKKVAARAKREALGSKFLTEHKEEILLFNVAEIYMKKNGIDTSFLDIRQMIDQHKQYLEERKILNAEVKETTEKVKELEHVKSNVEKILGERTETESGKNKKTVSKKKGKSTEMEI